ncbi:glycosyl hydrolase family 43 [Dyadobacter jejuensis]|uniref:Glycosyl hydrolase family 43 n=1 Tax=Dyadobacter jejuensis TaxID=1082580 RepID=A0A316ALL9_9BACT|nr:glycoside hydrolase family protein [Dyadobacter jejuensis]PWJ58695.1 glycosyl hydrolase family 43 [Dyadobacter jejuensis]
MKHIILILFLGATYWLQGCAGTASKSGAAKEGATLHQNTPNGVPAGAVESRFSESLGQGKRILGHPDWNVWGASPIKTEDGKIHVFFSRWRGEHKNWLTDSEIAHAVADRPEGPYTVVGTVLKGRGDDHWDAHTIHNSTFQKVGDKYALFYIGNNLNGLDLTTDARASTQRIGLALADDINGPFERVGEGPILDVSADPKDWDSFITVNPALLQQPNGEFWLYYKSWDKNNDNMRKMGVAIAKNIEGPYQRYAKNPIVTFADLKKQVEDAFIFRYQEKYYMVMRDMGVLHPHVGLILESADGLDWSKPKLGYRMSTAYFQEEKIERFERPQVLIENGRPTYLFLAVMGGEYGKSTASVLKIDPNKF